jgi:hypothetical protein
VEAAPRPKARRGTSNSNKRGGSEQRRRRREWLVETYRADVDLIWDTVRVVDQITTKVGAGMAACRCYHCGRLLTVDTVSVDRIIPGCQGGTYRRNNIRPVCEKHNSQLGGGLRRKGKK